MIVCRTWRQFTIFIVVDERSAIFVDEDRKGIMV
jgi:hypothetical protein